MFSHSDLDYAQGTQLRAYARAINLKGRSKLKVKQLKDALRATLPPREGTSPGLFVELCAGTAAVSLQLHREDAKPPVSRMGSKRGYAVAVLHALGLHPGLQADRYLWCEPDDGCRLLLETYRDHDLALKAAEIIRGWKDEDPRALWDRLRKEGPVKAPTPREAARWTLALPGGAWTFMPPKAMYKGPGALEDDKTRLSYDTVAARYENLDTLPAEVAAEAIDPREVARWVQIESCTQITGGFDIAGNYGYQGDGYHWKAAPKGWQAQRLEEVEQLTATIHPDALQVDPREVGRWLYMCARSGSSLNIGKSYLPEDNPHEGWGGTGVSRATLAQSLPDTPTLPAEITEEAVDPHEVARWCIDTAWSIGNDAGKGGFQNPHARKTDCLTVAGASARFEDLPVLPGEVTEEAVDPREVARWCVSEGWTMGNGGRCVAPGACPPGVKPSVSLPGLTARLDDLPTLPADLADGAVEPPLLPPNTVVYIDPPYVNTTGYKHDLPREKVVELALAWYDAGAKVAISEQEAIPELIAQGWTAVDITDKRLGTKRIFSKQQKEYLTLSPGAQCSHL
jgi:hypothetical protein